MILQGEIVAYRYKKGKMRELAEFDLPSMAKTLHQVIHDQVMKESPKASSFFSLLKKNRNVSGVL